MRSPSRGETGNYLSGLLLRPLTFLLLISVFVIRPTSSRAVPKEDSTATECSWVHTWSRVKRDMKSDTSENMHADLATILGSSTAY